ncbi:MAG: RNA 2',3'-cyclic phosphodiesterase [Telluria sp.]
MGGDTVRLFIALWPGPAVREALVQWRDGVAWPASASPVRTEQLHVTLHFLGSVPRERITELSQGLRVPFEPFELELGHRELWHDTIAVLAPDLVPAPLLALHASLTEALERLGMTPEARTYRPHVTLARRASHLTEMVPGPPIVWRVDGYALMRSKAGDGSEYSVVQAYSS